MSLFTLVKASVTTRQAAEYYGVKVDRNGMACCPFHNDRHPSMKLDRRYYCFACHETGDVIDFVGKLFHLVPYEAAVKIADDFGLHPTTPRAAAMRNTVPTESASQAWYAANPVLIKQYEKQNKERNREQDQRRRERECASVLISFERLLKEWREKYEPGREDECWDRHFAAALKTLPQVSYLIDCLYSPDASERAAVVENLTEDGTMEKLVRFMETHIQTEDAERGRTDEQAA